MDPVDPSKAAKPTACTLMATLPSEGDGDAAVDRILDGIPRPSTHDRLKAVGILVLKLVANQQLLELVVVKPKFLVADKLYTTYNINFNHLYDTSHSHSHVLKTLELFSTFENSL